MEVMLKKEESEKLVMNHVWGAVAVGLIPIPIVDMFALTAIQLNMVRKIAASYKIPFSKDKVKSILSALLGSAIPSSLGIPLSVSISKTIPVIGQSLGALSMPAIAGASTYAVGRVFVHHFSSGGTLLTLNPEKVRDYYVIMLKEGKKVVAGGNGNKRKHEEKNPVSEPEITVAVNQEEKKPVSEPEIILKSDKKKTSSTETVKRKGKRKKKYPEKISEVQPMAEMM